MFIQRLFEQEVQLALEKLLGSRVPLDPADAAAHQARLRLLADTYARTVKFAANCDRALRGTQARAGARARARRRCALGRG
jgi:hypothetical protein